MIRKLVGQLCDAAYWALTWLIMAAMVALFLVFPWWVALLLGIGFLAVLVAHA